MKIVATESKDVRTRVHIRVSRTDAVVAYGDVDILPDDAARQIQNILSAHPIERYPEGAYIGVFASADLESKTIRDPETIRAEPYPRGIEVSDFPPEENQLCHW